MNEVKRKLSSYRILKTISYLIGFPLFILMVFMCTVYNFYGQAAFHKTAFDGFNAAVLIWLGVTVLQIVFCLFIKNHKARTLFTISISVGVMLTTAIIFDSYASKRIDEVRAEYEEYNVTIQDYDYQISWFDPLTSGKEGLSKAFAGNINNFLNIYHIGYMSSNVGGENTDSSPVEYNAEDDAYYSENGLFSDGYVFGIKQAMHILTRYYEIQDYYESNGKDADEELQKVLRDLEENPASEWNYYKQSEEYQAAYGENGEAYKYMLSVERLNLILSALGRELQDNISGIGQLLETIGMEDIGQLVGSINENLDAETIVELINSLGLFEEDITLDEIMDLLKDFSFYQSPLTQPIFNFIDDEILKEYGYITYYGSTHGAKIGSVLIGKEIGQIDMDHSGHPAYVGYNLDQLRQLEVDMAYKADLYPYFALRRYLYIFAGIVGLSAFLTVHFSNKEKEVFSTLTIKEAK